MTEPVNSHLYRQLTSSQCAAHRRNTFWNSEFNTVSRIISIRKNPIESFFRKEWPLFTWDILTHTLKSFISHLSHTNLVLARYGNWSYTLSMDTPPNSGRYLYSPMPHSSKVKDSQPCDIHKIVTSSERPRIERRVPIRFVKNISISVSSSKIIYCNGYSIIKFT